jgi:hypothetical protein
MKMNRKDIDLNLWSYIQSESTFFDLPIDEVTELLESDFSMDDGISELNFMFSKTTERELNRDYKEDKKLAGSESTIYWKIRDPDHIYKLNDPNNKFGSNRFNEIIMHYILQEYLFPKFKYDNLLLFDKKMFIRQIMSNSRKVSIDKIKLYMEKDGFNVYSSIIFWTKIKDIGIMVYDLNIKNCRIK